MHWALWWLKQKYLIPTQSKAAKDKVIVGVKRHGKPHWHPVCTPDCQITPDAGWNKSSLPVFTFSCWITFMITSWSVQHLCYKCLLINLYQVIFLIVICTLESVFLTLLLVSCGPPHPVTSCGLREESQTQNLSSFLFSLPEIRKK